MYLYQHIKSRIKKSLFQLQKKQLGIHVLTYHGVIEKRTFPRLQRNFHDVEEFSQQINFLKSKGAWVMHPNEFEEVVLQGNISKVKKAVLLTFDDGYKNNLLASEILNDSGFNAAYFVSTESIETAHSVWTVNLSLLLLCGSLRKVLFNEQELYLGSIDQKKIAFNRIREVLKMAPTAERIRLYTDILQQYPSGEIDELIEKNPEFKMMTWQQVKQLVDRGERIESHGVFHELFHLNQEPQVVLSELVHSKRQIEEKLGTKISWYAYPNGDDTYAEIKSAMQAAGYSLGFSLGNKPLTNTDAPFFIPRYEKPRNSMLELVF